MEVNPSAMPGDRILHHPENVFGIVANALDTIGFAIVSGKVPAGDLALGVAELLLALEGHVKAMDDELIQRDVDATVFPDTIPEGF